MLSRFRSNLLAAAILSTSVALTSPALSASASPSDTQTTISGYMYSWVSWFGGVLGYVDASIDAEIAKMRDALVDDATALESLIDRTGFSLDEVRIGMGPIPTIGLGISYERDITDEERADLIKHIETSGDVGAVEKTLVYTLLEIADGKHAKSEGVFSLKGLDVDVDLIPGITLILGKDGDGAEAPDPDVAPAPAAAPTTPVETAPTQGG